MSKNMNQRVVVLWFFYYSLKCLCCLWHNCSLFLGFCLPRSWFASTISVQGWRSGAADGGVGGASSAIRYSAGLRLTRSQLRAETLTGSSGTLSPPASGQRFVPGLPEYLPGQGLTLQHSPSLAAPILPDRLFNVFLEPSSRLFPLWVTDDLSF